LIQSDANSRRAGLKQIIFELKTRPVGLVTTRPGHRRDRLTRPP
jgi:hypothetical protein